MKKRFWFILLMVIAIGCKKSDIEVPSTESTPLAPAPNITQYMPSSLPHHLSFGVENDYDHRSQFIQEADYRYQYLAGDIFGKGWTTWNAPSGQFARNFLTQTAQMGKMPVFTYYNIVPARGLYQDPAFANLSDAGVMNKYFDDWKALLKICKEFGQPVIIHYEPDLLGYMQMYKGDAAKSVIQVNNSNQADVKGFSNDAKGLAQAIVSMRDKYAPNVLLGWHASQWATGRDLVKGKHNPEELAAQTAAYYRSLEAKFDLLFTEFSDRDAGFDEHVMGKGNTMWTTTATAANGNLSDFDRFQRFIKRLNQETGQKVILWQIPVGNTLTSTCNNTNGHYKDNRAEYFLQPVMQNSNMDRLNGYADAGVIAFLFGRGAADCTSYMDSKKDGVTNSAETADDDGGYLRKAIKAYYVKGALPVR
jgi:hypothetical protein